jgi:hypothetical protein
MPVKCESTGCGGHGVVAVYGPARWWWRRKRWHYCTRHAEAMSIPVGVHRWRPEHRR